MTAYPTANTATNEYFVIREVGSLNTTIEIFDCGGSRGVKTMPNAKAAKWIEGAKRLMA